MNTRNKVWNDRLKQRIFRIETVLCLMGISIREQQERRERCVWLTHCGQIELLDFWTKNPSQLHIWVDIYASPINYWLERTTERKSVNFIKNPKPKKTKNWKNQQQQKSRPKTRKKKKKKLNLKPKTQRPKQNEKLVCLRFEFYLLPGKVLGFWDFGRIPGRRALRGKSASRGQE